MIYNELNSLKIKITTHTRVIMYRLATTMKNDAHDDEGHENM